MLRPACRPARATLFLLALCAAWSGPVLSQNTPAATQADAGRFLEDVKALAAPRMEGRGDGTRGLRRAERLIAERYRALGMEAAGSQGYRQTFRVVTGRKIRPGTRLVAASPTWTAYKLKQEFIPLSFSSSGTVRSTVVFAGYGISAPEFAYDDYHGADVRGKIVLVLRGEPRAIAQKAEHGEHTSHASLITKAINAKNHGAAALIVVNGKPAGEAPDDLLRFGSVEGPEEAGLPCLQIKTAIADLWLKGASRSVADTEESIERDKQAAQAAVLNVVLDLAVRIETQRSSVSNILAYLPGRTDEYVIVGAHYDHLGRGFLHSLAPSQAGQIHPGADDNASGTAGVLELARMFGPLKGRLDRGILFANFAGEELGLLGSAEWLKAPTRPIEKAVAMLNMDMIGRIKDQKVFIGGVGTGTTLKQVLESSAKGSALRLEFSQSGYSSSDHTSFVTRRIPVLFFFSGLHSDYHKPSDSWEKINASAAAELLDLVSAVTRELAEGAGRPQFVAVAENPHAGGVSSGGGYGPYFGSIPDFGETENGVRFSDVRPGSPAAKAGLLAGDVLVQFGDKPIKNLYDFTDALRRSKVGDAVEVTVLRAGQPLKVSVTLAERK